MAFDQVGLQARAQQPIDLEVGRGVVGLDVQCPSAQPDEPAVREQPVGHDLAPKLGQVAELAVGFLDVSIELLGHEAQRKVFAWQGSALSQQVEVLLGLVGLHRRIVPADRIRGMNVILFGYRGSGKTSVGKKLAEQLWKDFVDVDALVRERFGGITIAEIWEQWGEAGFRQAEVEATQAVVRFNDHVIALGGGTLMQPAAREAVEQAPEATRIYLRCDPEVLYQRIAGDETTPSERPALTDQGGGLQEVEQVLAERDPVYRSVADVVFDATYCTIEQTVQHLITKL